jgi:hypothetical protein
MARDILERRKHQPTIPTDLKDRARFGQAAETVKDAIVEELRIFFERNLLTQERRQELPTVRKYATSVTPGTDPYETFARFLQEYPDLKERLPHVAVTALAGQNQRMTVGRPILAATQLPPRVVSQNAGPYALANPVYETRTITVPTAAPGSYVVTLFGLPISYSAGVGDDRERIATRLASLIRGVAYPILSIAVDGNVITLRAIDQGFAFSVSVSGNLTLAVVASANAATASDQLVFRTTPTKTREPVISAIQFAPHRFTTSELMGALPASALARVFNEQALYATAKVVPVGLGTGLRLETGGREGNRTPNEIEVLAGSTRALVTALGLGHFGNTAGTDTIALGTASGEMILNVAAAPFLAVMATDRRYLTLTDAPTAGNNGRFKILSVPAPSQIVFENENGVAETLTTATEWFVGLRDDWENPVRPVQNRYHLRFSFTVTLSVYNEDPHARTELSDLILSEFAFFLEEKHFTFLGRSVFDDSVSDEYYQISVHQEVSHAGESDLARSGEQKNRIYESKIQVPVSILWPIDRPVLVPSGPDAGASYTITDEDDITYDDSVIFPG